MSWVWILTPGMRHFSMSLCSNWLRPIQPPFQCLLWMLSFGYNSQNVRMATHICAKIKNAFNRTFTPQYINIFIALVRCFDSSVRTRMWMPKVGSRCICCVVVTKWWLWWDGTLCDVRNTIHVRSSTLMMSMPMYTCALCHQVVLHIHYDTITLAYLTQWWNFRKITSNLIV